MLSSVASTSFLSWRLAPSTARPTGTPLASVSRLRLVPRLPRSVGFRPVRSPPSGALVMAPSIASHSQSSPFISSYSCRPRGPEVDEDAGGGPLLEAAVGRGVRADAGGVQGPPLAAGAEHEEDGVHGLAVGDPGVVAAQRMGGPGRQQRYDAFPQRVGDTPLIIDGRSGVGRGAGPSLGHETRSRRRSERHTGIVCACPPTGIRS